MAFARLMAVVGSCARHVETRQPLDLHEPSDHFFGRYIIAALLLRYALYALGK